MSDTTIGICLLGCGTVGGGVVKVLREQKDLLLRRTGINLELRHVVVKSKDEYPANAAELPMSTDAAPAIDDPASQIIVELIGGTGVAGQFVEVLIAPKVTAAAREALAKKGNVRVLEVPLAAGANVYDTKRVGGGMLVQSPDGFNITANDLRVVTKKQPSAQQLEDLLFAWRVAKFVKSNAIVFCANGQTLGVGAGQMSRVDSARIASIKAQNANLALAGSVVASDAFFPFRDGLDVVADAGAVAVIQPGGSMRDAEVIAAADERGIAMVFTAHRHFRH